jgi:hypothetical protein
MRGDPTIKRSFFFFPFPFSFFFTFFFVVVVVVVVPPRGNRQGERGNKTEMQSSSQNQPSGLSVIGLINSA